ncbi:hypothetical protein [Microbacterium sp. LWH10-1.2]|uniref:hypothetical protein n=1 Tax=Microbacterium sp. LWH10-1.2 TaxID=3135255 RepID=UPI003138C622
MSSELVNVAADLEAYLVDTCPPEWRVINGEKYGSRVNGIVLAYDQLDITTSVLGTDVTPGFVAVGFDLYLIAPETDAVKGLLRVTSAMADLYRALDQTDQIPYADAQRGRLETGESTYRLPVAVITTYLPITPLETPAP